MISDRLIKKINSHKIVSFDIFDTALIRNVTNYQNVFKIIDSIVGNDFYDKRVCRENIVIQELQKKAPSLNDIYSNFFDKKIMNLEIDVEKKNLSLNDEIYNIYDYCIQNDKIVIFTSDMYLSKESLEGILKSKGYKVFKKVFVSSEYNKTKADGDLFDQIISELKCNKSDIIHIGDSLRNDYLAAKKSGFDAFLYRKRKLNCKEKPLAEDIYLNFINNKNIDGSYSYKCGYNYYGILLYSFSLWLLRNFKEKNIKNVFFLSRDGYIMKKAFDMINSDNDIKTNYLKVSRRSLCVPNLWKNSEFNDLENNIPFSNYFSVANFIEKLGLNPIDYKKEIEKNGLVFEDIISKKNFLNNKKIRLLYDTIRKDVIANSKEEYSALLQYLKDNKFEGVVAIVDIGWHGTMQKQLTKVIKELNVKSKIYGYYMGQEKKIENGRGFLFNEFDRPNNKISIAGSFGFFESLFLGNHGSIKCYKIHNNKVDVELCDYEFKNSESLKIIKDFQRGALDFCHDFSQNKYLKHLDFDCNIAFMNIKKICVNPTLKDLNEFKDIMFNDTYNEKIIECRGLFYYLFHPKRLKIDFYKSVWKIGFIKCLFKVKFPYFKLYYLLKK